MAKGKEQLHGSPEPTNPTQGAGASSPFSAAEYSFLEIVMTMHDSMGQLKEAVNELKRKQDEQGKKLDSISHKVYAAVAIVLVLGGILTFFAKSINDAITIRLSAPIYLQQPTPSPPPAPGASK